MIYNEQLISGSIYCSSLALITPPLIGYNLKALYNLHYQPTQWVRASTRMIPTQLALRTIQLATASQIREHTNPWIGFAFMGIMQGIIYGHANTSWLKYLKLPVRTSPNAFRGILFATSRDTISQGVPFSLRENGAPMVAVASIGATIASQGFHNCQTIMQVKSNLSHYDAINKGWSIHGISLFYKGFQARLVMMSSINALNYLLLKDIWQK